MKKCILAIMITSILFTLGCKRIRYNDNMNYPTELVETNYQRDEQYCLAVASGMTPNPQMIPVPQSYSIDTRGYIDTTYGSAQYRQRTYVNNDQAALNAGMYNLGAGIAAKKQRAQNYNMCMESIGWRLRENLSPAALEEKQKIDRRYELYKRLNADPMFKQVLTYMLEQAKRKPESESAVILNAWRENPEIFERDYELARPVVAGMLEKSAIVK